LAPVERSARPSADPRERDGRERFRGAITSQEERVLWEAGRFRTVAVSDLARQHYAGDYSRLERDLKHLTKLRLAERHTAPTDGRGRTLSVVTLTKAGKKLLSVTDRIGSSSSQAIYTGLVKPRELTHDAAIYRMYLAEAARIEANGGRVQRVVLDYELKQKVYSPLAKAHDLAPFARAERQQEVADENQLPVVDGRIALPDLRVEYETPEGEPRHIDLELATRNYRAAHIQTKAAAGFKVYADTNSGPLSRVFDNHNLIVELLRT
jgi:DNA-binding HxlR family transcriptional regulator